MPAVLYILGRVKGAGMMRVEYYYDLVSPYSYLAYGRVGRICEENGAELVLRPMCWARSTRR